MLGIFRREKPEKEEREKPEKLEVLLKEYERLSNEMGYHFGIQSQLKAIALLLLGAIATAISFLAPFFQSIKDPSIPLIGLLLISFLFTSLLLAYQLQILEFVFIALYVDKVLRPQIFEIFEIKDTNDQDFFSWDRYHERLSFAKSRIGTFVYHIQVYSLFSIMAVPALLALIIAIIWISVRFSILVSNIFTLIVLFLLIILDVFCLAMTIFCEFYRIKMQKQVEYKN